VLQQRGELRRVPDAHLELVVALVVGVVEQFRGTHRLDLAAQSQQRQREQVVGEAGVDTGGEAGRPARRAGLGDRIAPHPGDLVRVRPHPRRHRRRADVDAGPQEGADDADVVIGQPRGRTVVNDRVGPQRDQLVHRIRGVHAGLLPAAQIAGVGPDLVRVADADPGQFEARVTNDLGQHHRPDDTGAPQNDPFPAGCWHDSSLTV
jgi:hypothetical protein